MCYTVSTTSDTSPAKCKAMQGISRKKGADAFILAMASGKSVKDAAASAEINESTAHRRLRSPKENAHEWQAAIAAKRSELVHEAAGRITARLTAAADALHDLMQNGESHNVRLGAARALLDFGLRYQPGGEEVSHHHTGPPMRAELDLSGDALDVLRSLNISEKEE